MRQAIEIRKLSAQRRPRSSWLARMWALLFRNRDARGAIPLDHRSAHLLRDIGLGEDARASRRLQDHQLFRR